MKFELVFGLWCGEPLSHQVFEDTDPYEPRACFQDGSGERDEPWRGERDQPCLAAHRLLLSEANNSIIPLNHDRQIS